MLLNTSTGTVRLIRDGKGSEGRRGGDGGGGGGRDRARPCSLTRKDRKARLVPSEQRR